VKEVSERAVDHRVVASRKPSATIRLKAGAEFSKRNADSQFFSRAFVDHRPIEVDQYHIALYEGAIIIPADSPPSGVDGHAIAY
jgi:hypothetical protein